MDDREWVIEVPGRAELANDFRRMRNHHQRSRITKKWRDNALAAIKAARIPPLGAADVAVVRHGITTRPPDVDGIAGGAAKNCLDALQDAGVIPNDDARHLRVTEYRHARVRHPWEERLELRIRQREEGPAM